MHYQRGRLPPRSKTVSRIILLVMAGSAVAADILEEQDCFAIVLSRLSMFSVTAAARVFDCGSNSCCLIFLYNHITHARLLYLVLKCYSNRTCFA